MLYLATVFALLAAADAAKNAAKAQRKLSEDPMSTSCRDVKAVFKGEECCSNLDGTASTSALCPPVETVVAYSAMRDSFSPCEEESVYKTYNPEHPVVPGYTGCTSELSSDPCGIDQYYEYSPDSGCTTVATVTSALQIVRGGSPTMSEDMLRLTGAATLPQLNFPMIPMSYPHISGSSPDSNPMLDLTTYWKQLLTYIGSEIAADEFKFYPTYGAEQGMVGMIATKVLELARTTCNRDFYAYLKAPAYGYDWTQAIAYADMMASSFYSGPECPCYNTSTCNDKGTLSISQVGWGPAQTTLPEKESATGMMYTPDSDSPDSPWFQTNVVPGNPIGRFEPCVTPRERCLCDGVYWYPGFVAEDTVLSDPVCYSWAMSLTKVYSAQLRAGVMMIQDYPEAVSAASAIMNKKLAIANGLYSYLQSQGQVELIKQMMAKPFSDPTSWLHAFRTAQHEKWDVMDAAFDVCEAAGILKRTDEQPKYFGAYIFGHMMPEYCSLSTNIGAASNDFFKSVVGYDHFNYYWGWRGEDVTNYGFGVPSNITSQDYFRIHTFRDYSIYEEEARRMTIVCSDKDAKVSSEYLSVNEWKLVRSIDTTRRRKLSDITDVNELARQLKEDVPRLSNVAAIKLAERTHASQDFQWEYGMPSEWNNVY